MFAAARILQQDEPRHHVAIARGRTASAMTPSSSSVQAIRLSVSSARSSERAIPPIEVGDQTPAHLEIRLAARIDPIVQPLEEPLERSRRQDPLFSSFSSHNASRSRAGRKVFMNASPPRRTLANRRRPRLAVSCEFALQQGIGDRSP